MAYSQNEALLLSNIDNLHSQLLEQQEYITKLEQFKARYEHLKAQATPLRSGPFWENGKATYTLHWDISPSALPLPADTFDEAVDSAIKAKSVEE